MSEESGAASAREQEKLHAAARAACDIRPGAYHKVPTGSVPSDHTTTLASGGWCLTPPHPGFISHHSGGTVTLPNNQSYVLTASHYAADSGIVGVIAALLSSKLPFVSATGHSRHGSIIDFGAGIGQYGHALLALQPRIDWRGFDGAGNVEEYTDGFVK